MSLVWPPSMQIFSPVITPALSDATGLPVMQYILRRRLLHGVYAMKQGQSKIDAALSFSFDTYAGFYKAFCREFGTIPTNSNGHFVHFATRPFSYSVSGAFHGRRRSGQPVISRL